MERKSYWIEDLYWLTMLMLIVQLYFQSSHLDLTQLQLLSLITMQPISQICTWWKVRRPSLKLFIGMETWTLDSCLTGSCVMFPAVRMRLFERFLRNGQPGAWMMGIVCILSSWRFCREGWGCCRKTGYWLTQLVRIIRWRMRRLLRLLFWLQKVSLSWLSSDICLGRSRHDRDCWPGQCVMMRSTSSERERWSKKS